MGSKMRLISQLVTRKKDPVGTTSLFFLTIF